MQLCRNIGLEASGVYSPAGFSLYYLAMVVRSDVLSGMKAQ